MSSIAQSPLTCSRSPLKHVAHGWTSSSLTQPTSLVLIVDGHLAGYATSAQLRPKAAYDTSVECSIYLDPSMTGHGYGKQLYNQLLLNLQQHDVHRCYGIITLPNLASVGLHQQLGFTEMGLLTEVGRKFGTYWDTLWMQKNLRSTTS